MNPFAIGNRATGFLLLIAVTILAAGCASGGTSTQVYASYGYYGGYYPGYDPYYHGDVIVTPPPPPAVERPPGERPPASPPHVSQLPSRPLPAPAPRPTPRAAPRGGGRGR